MVASVTDSSLLTPGVSSVRPAASRADTDNTTSAQISTSLRREVAVTAKFGPDPVTGSPFQIISGDDVEAAETNDLQRLAEANLGLVSPQTAFQAQSIRSDEDIARETGPSQSAEAAQQSLLAAQSSFSEIGGTGNSASSERGSTVDVQV
ncbi:MAG: hypothetical protein VW835_09225 [Rickettsiales bacterium]